MIYRVQAPQNKILKGDITLTASKSESNRALIIQAICDHSFEIENLAAAEDTRVLKEILSKVKTNQSTDEQIYDVGAAGTTMRFLTAYLSTVHGSHFLTGSERMKNRPIGILVDALRDLGAEIEYAEKEGFPPLQIKGKSIKGGDVLMDGNVSSQYVSALLLVSTKFENGLTLKFKGNITSVPYINMTLRMLEEFQVKASWKGNSISVAQQHYKIKNSGYTYFVEGDWSSASYWFAMAALAETTDLTIKGLNKAEQSLQGDAANVEIFSKLGVQAKQLEKGYQLQKGTAPFPSLNYDFSDCPDLAQTIATVCSALNVPAKFSGLHTLRIKETDRSLALQNELKKLGTDVKMFGDDVIVITPGRLNLAPAPIKTYEDHRMAMAFVVFAFVCNYIDIEEPEVVKKSYPDFWKDLKMVGFTIQEL